MSNLIKSVYFNNTNEGKKCVIDSDSRINEFIPEIYQSSSGDGFEPFQYGQFPDISAGTDNFPGDINVIGIDGAVDGEEQELPEEMAAKCGELLDEARSQADGIIAQANSQAESIRNDAYEEGRAQGYEDGQKEAAALLGKQQDELRNEYKKMAERLKEQERQLEPHFAEITAALVEKLTGVICKGKKDVIVHLIDNALHSIEKTDRVVVRVSKNDIGVVSAKRNVLVKELKEGTEFEITEDAGLIENQCIIETDNKIIDCSIDAQLDNLRQQLKMLAM